MKEFNKTLEIIGKICNIIYDKDYETTKRDDTCLEYNGNHLKLKKSPTSLYNKIKNNI